jgi:serine protease Do
MTVPLVMLASGMLVAGAAQAQQGGLPADTSSARDSLFKEVARELSVLERQGNLLKKVVKLVKPSVVHIEAQRTEAGSGRYGGPRSVEEAGSGVIIHLNGNHYVLTNRHVIQGAKLSDIKIKLADGRAAQATKVWEDRGTDVAVIALGASHYVAARLGDSDDLEIGDFVLAVGSPFGLSHSVTYGIISAKGRRDLELGSSQVRYQDFLQTDAAINPGNSGGPLLNLRAEVIGVNTAIASNSGGNEGIGFSIPINMAMVVARQLVEHGAVSHAYLGVRLENGFGPEMAARLGLPAVRGALVKGITPNSPAHRANIRVHDIIVRFNGVRIEDDSHLVNLVSLTPLDESVTVGVLRTGQPMSFRVRVSDRSRYEPEP